MSDNSNCNRQGNSGSYKSPPGERYNFHSKRDSRTCAVCENSKKSFTYKEFEVHCVSIAHIINEARLNGDKKEFPCNICRFKCSSKEEMINHINTPKHEESVEIYQYGGKYKNNDNSFYKKRKIQEGTDLGIVVPTKCHGYYGSGETMSDFSKTSKDGGIYVTRSVRNEVINKHDDESTHISAPRCTLINSRNLPGIRENCLTQKKAELNNDNNSNTSKHFPKQAVPIKVSKPQTTLERDYTTAQSTSAQSTSAPTTSSDTVKKNFHEAQVTDLESSISNNNDNPTYSQFSGFIQSTRNLSIFTEISNDKSEFQGNEEYYVSKYDKASTKDLINSMGKVYNDLMQKKHELIETQKVIKKMDEEFRFIFKKVSENYQKNV